MSTLIITEERVRECAWRAADLIDADSRWTQGPMAFLREQPPMRIRHEWIRHEWDSPGPHRNTARPEHREAYSRCASGALFAVSRAMSGYPLDGRTVGIAGRLAVAHLFDATAFAFEELHGMTPVRMNEKPGMTYDRVVAAFRAVATTPEELVLDWGGPLPDDMVAA